MYTTLLFSKKMFLLLYISRSFVSVTPSEPSKPEEHSARQNIIILVNIQTLLVSVN